MIGNDYIVERFKLKNTATNWKFFSILLILLFAFTFFYNKSDIGYFSKEKDYIASINIKGVIMHDQETLKSLQKIKNNNNIKAVIVNINSPGGTSVGGESLYYAFMEMASAKPIVTSIAETATSAAYLAALGTDWIVAYETSLTGSIGVVLQNIEISELAQKLGIALEVFKSSQLKGIPNNFEKLNANQKEYIQSIIDNSYKIFAQRVKERRNLSTQELNVVTDGRVFIGAKAKELKLIDQLGNKETVIAWLKDNNDKLKKLEVRHVELVQHRTNLQKFLESTSNTLLFVTSLFNQVTS
jgi:protease-4